MINKVDKKGEKRRRKEKKGEKRRKEKKGKEREGGRKKGKKKFFCKKKRNYGNITGAAVGRDRLGTKIFF